jgi:hypothetical protein
VIVPFPLRLTGTAVGLLLAMTWGLSLVQPPAGTGPGLDESWRIGLTLAAEHGLRFGQDIVFSFGPLGFALQGVPDPALAVPAMVVKMLLAAGAVAGVWTAVAGRGKTLLKLAFAAIAVFVATNVTIDYVAAIGVVALLMRAGRHPRAAPFVGLAVGAVGLIGALSKYTLCLDVLAGATVVWLVAALRGPRRRRRGALLAAALGYGVTAAGLAVAFGFSAPALGAYLRGAAAISSGYSAGMALRGPRIEIALALAVGAAIVVLALAAVRERKPEQAVLAAVVIFLAWKHGFVRQDGHILYFFDTAAAVAPLLGITLRRNAAALAGVAATALALGALLWAQSRTLHAIPPFFEPARIVFGGAYLLDPRGTATRLAAGLDAALAPDRLPRDIAARIGSATVDVWPWETAIVRAGGLHWAPLPVFQAYSAYTPLLDRLNRDALVGHGAAYYLYRYLAVDGRFPLGEAPATTTELLCRYAVAVPRVTTAAATGATTGNDAYVLLRRDGAARCDAEPAGRASAPALGAPIAIPPAGSPDAFVVAAFDLRPTLANKVLTALWRGPETFVSVRYDDGSTRMWRVTAATLPDGLVVSAFPRDDAEAEQFLSRRPVHAVRELTLLAPSGSYVLDGVTFTRERRR